uniref:Olfactory receptor C family, w1 n=1 Tax=Gadus morhua TaxID=8049 RepID=A0A8C4ZN80_GADMO
MKPKASVNLPDYVHLHVLLWGILSVMFNQVETKAQQCKLIPGSMSLPVLQRNGDITLGGLFSLHDMVVEPNRLFTTMPPHPRFNFRTFRWMQTMIFAIEEINREGKLLPNVTLGYKIYDSCSTPYQALKAAMELMGTEQDSEVEMVDNHMCHGTVPVVIGDGGSTQSLVVARFLGAFNVPQVSYFSSCACLSNKMEYPAFLRTMPSDLFQVRASIWSDILTGHGWVVRQSLTMRDAMAAIVSRIRSSGALVVLVFAVEQDAAALFDEALRQGLSGIHWLASEAWSTASVLSTPKKYQHILQGTIGLALRRAQIPGLQDFLLRLHPSNSDASENPFLIPFWEEVFGCRLGERTLMENENYKPPCSGTEDLKSIKNIYNDVSQLRISYNVYKAVYAIAHAIKAMKSCNDGAGPFLLQACSEATNIQPWQLLHYLKEVEYTNQFGDETMFDQNGDPVAMYDLVNWQLGSNGEMQFITIGMFDGTAPAGRKKLQLQDNNILWNDNKTMVPQSECSSPCPSGTRKAIRPNFPVCCHDCVVCRAGEIKCLRCLPLFWSNVERTACFPKEVDFLSFSDTMGKTLTTVALLGSLCTCWVIFIFSCHISTPIVRANNSELSFLLLFSLNLCFLCSLTFIGRPSDWSCMLRHTAFGITFVLCISCVLGKTLVVLMAFKASLPGSNLMKWFGPVQQRAIITLSTLVQVIICIIWLTVAPPTPQKLMPRESAIVLLLCDEGSALGFALVLGYIGLLACLCLFLAFLARKLPDNFNEAKLITFSMLIFCAVWVAFIPAYISSPGKYSVAVEIFAILASSYGLLACIFAPKCYIILLRPEKNSRKHLMSKTNVQ